MAQDSGDLTLLGSVKKKTESIVLPRPIPKIRELGREAFKSWLGGMFDSLDDALFTMADRARSNNEQTYFFDSMREVRVQRRKIEASFLSHLDSKYVAMRSSNDVESKAQAGEKPVEELALVQQDAFEVSVAFTAMVTRCRGSLTAELFSINTRFDSLFRHKIDHRNNPLDPKQICDAFDAAIQELDVDVECRLLLLKNFERCVLSRVKGLLSNVEKVLVKAGISPKAKIKRRAGSAGGAKGSLGQGADSFAGSASSADSFASPGLVQSSGSANSGAPTLGSGGSAGSYNSQTIFGAPPTLNSSLGNDAQGDSAQQTTGASSLSAEAQYQSPHAADNTELFGYLQGLLSSSPGQGREPILSTAGQSAGGPSYIVGRNDLLSMLNTIQAEAPVGQNGTEAQADGPAALDLRGALSDLLNQHITEDGRKARISPFDEDVIDLVSMFFDFILDDSNLPTDVQALIGRLQIPLLRLAIRDRAFFNKPTHPARQLLNRLASEGACLEEGAKGRKDPAYRKIAEVVARILKDFDGSIVLFEELLVDFIAFQSKEENRSVRVEDKAQQTEIGKVKTEQARSLVQRMIEDRLSGKPINKALLPWFNETWSQVMFHLGLKEGPESEKWYQAVEALDSLVWALVPRRDYKSRIRWAQILPRTFEQVRSGLTQINIDPRKQNQMLAALELGLGQCLRESYDNRLYPLGVAESIALDSVVTLSERIEQEVIESEKIIGEHDRPHSILPENEFEALLASETSTHKSKTSGTYQTAIDQQLEREQVELQEYLIIADGIEVGSWVVFSPAAGGRLRCKLSAKLNDNNTFVFVNRRGQKVFEQKKKLVAQELRRQRLQVVDRRPLFDRALDSIVSRLGPKDAARFTG